MKKQLLNGISFLLRVFTGNYTWLQDRTPPGAISAEDEAFPVPWIGLIAKSPKNERKSHQRTRSFLII
jgi:hypothetical protein